MARPLDITLALSGGAARGAFHLGALAAFERNGVNIKAVSGSSIGAVIAVGVGSGVSPYDMLKIFKSKTFRNIFEFNYFRKGLFKINEKAEILRDISQGLKLEEMKIPTFITCTDIKSSKIIRFKSGDTIKLCIASSALVPLFSPIEYEDFLLIDGGFMDNLPIEPLLGFDAPLVSINLFPLRQKDHFAILSALKRAILLNLFASIKEQVRRSDICITNEALSAYSLFSFGKLDACFELGYRSASEGIEAFML